MKKEKNNWNISFNTFIHPLVFAVLFYSIAVWRYLATDRVFYLYNFGYIGTSLAIGLFFAAALPKKHSLWGRRIAQFLVGSYMLFFVGVFSHENMQFEGFIFYLLMGVFAGSTLHYFIAKIAGPLFFGRGWCAWACWTAMFLDLLPWKKPAKGRIRYFGLIRYVHFLLSAGLVLYTWFVLKIQPDHLKTSMELHWFAIGNLLYYMAGFILAAFLRDNRAFCKYICPIPILQKIGSPFSILKMRINEKTCIDCGLCEKNCPMGIRLMEYKNTNDRVMSSECITCTTCQDVCPENAVNYTYGFDFSFKNHVYYSDKQLNYKLNNRRKELATYD